MPDDLHAIVQRMVDAGESEENIATVIQHFKASAPSAEPAMKPDPFASARATAGGAPASELWQHAKDNPAQTGALIGSGLLTAGAGGPLVQIARAALGGAGGAGVGIAADAAQHGPSPSMANDVLEMGKQGGLAAGGQAAGEGAAKLVSGTGRLLYRTALAPTEKILSKYPNVVSEGLSTQTPVTAQGAAQAAESKAARMATKASALSDADQRVTYHAAGITGDAAPSLTDYAVKQIKAGYPDPTPEIAERLARFRDANPNGTLGPTSLDEVKGTIDDATGLAHRKLRMREPVTGSERTDVELTKAMGRAQASAVPGYKDMNRGIMDAEGLRKAIERRTAGSGGNQGLDTLLALMKGPAGIPARVGMMPAVMSRGGIVANDIGKSGVLPDAFRTALLAALGHQQER